MLHPHNLFKLQDVFEDCDFSNDVEKKTLTLTLLLLLLSRTFYQYRCENPVCSNLKEKIYILLPMTDVMEDSVKGPGDGEEFLFAMISISLICSSLISSLESGIRYFRT